MSYLGKYEKIAIFLGVLICLFSSILMFGLKFMPQFFEKKEEKQISKVFEEIIYQSDETVQELLDSFSTLVKENGLREINYDYLSKKDNTYYIGLYQDVLLFITTKDDSEKERELVYQTGIITAKKTVNNELARSYLKCLIKANKVLLMNDDEIINKVVSLKGKTYSNDSNLLFAYISLSDENDYVIERK